MKKNDFINGLKRVLIDNGFEEYIDEILNEKYGMGIFENNNWFCNCSDCLVYDVILDEVDVLIDEYCEKNNVGFIV